MAWKKIESGTGTAFKFDIYMWQGSKKVNKYKCVYTPTSKGAIENVKKHPKNYKLVHYSKYYSKARGLY